MTQEEHLDSSHQSSNSVYDQVSDDSNKSKNNATSNQLDCVRISSINEKTNTVDKALDSGDKVDINQVGQTVEEHSGKSKDEEKCDQNNNNLEMTVISHQNSGENIRDIQTKIENSEKNTCGEGDNSGENTEVLQKVGENSQENFTENEEKKGASDKVNPESVKNEASEENIKLTKLSDEDDPFARLRVLKANISNVLSQVKAVLTEHGVDNPNELEKDDIKQAEDNTIRFRFVRRIRKRSVFDEEEKKEAIEKKDVPVIETQTEDARRHNLKIQQNDEQDIQQSNDDKLIGHAKERSTYEKSEPGTDELKMVSHIECNVNNISNNIVNKTVEIVISEPGNETSEKAKFQEIKNSPELQIKSVEIQNNTQEPKEDTNASNNSALSSKDVSIIQPETVRTFESNQSYAKSLETKDEKTAESSTTTEYSLDSSMSIGPEYEVKVVDIIKVNELTAPSSTSIKKAKEGEKSQKKSVKSKTKTTPKIETPSAEKVTAKNKKIKTDTDTPKRKERKCSLVKDGAKVESQLDEKKKVTTKTKCKKLESSNKEVLPAVKVNTKTIVPIESKAIVDMPSKAKVAAPKKDLVELTDITATESPTKLTIPSKTSVGNKEITTKPRDEVIAPEKSILGVKQDHPKTEIGTKKPNDQNEKVSIEKSERAGPNSNESARSQNAPEETHTSEDKIVDIQKVHIPKDETISNSSTLTIPNELFLSEEDKLLPQLLISEEKQSEMKEVKISSNPNYSQILPKVEEKPSVVPLISKAEEVPQVPQGKSTSKLPSNTEKGIPSEVSSQPKLVPTSALEKVLATTNLKLIAEPRPPVVLQKTLPTKTSIETITTQNQSQLPINLNDNTKTAESCRHILPAAIPSDVTQSQVIATSSSKEEKIVLKSDPSETSSQQNATLSVKEFCDHDDKSTIKISKEVTEIKQEKKISEKAEEKKSVDKVPLKIESNKIRTVSAKPTLTLLPTPVKAVQLAPKNLELVPIPKASQLAVVQVHHKKVETVVTYQSEDEQQKDDGASCDAISIQLEEEKEQEQSKGEELPESPVVPEEIEKLERDEKPEATSGKKLCSKKRKTKKKVVIKRVRRRLSTDGTISNRQNSLESAEPEICEKVINVQLDPEPEPEPEPEEEKPLPGPKSCLKIREYQPGDIVMYADRIKKIVKWKKAEVLERITSISYKLNVEGEEKSCHICYIKKYTGKKVQFGGKEYLEIDYAQEESSDEEAEVYNIWARV